MFGDDFGAILRNPTHPYDARSFETSGQRRICKRQARFGGGAARLCSLDADGVRTFTHGLTVGTSGASNNRRSVDAAFHERAKARRGRP